MKSTLTLIDRFRAHLEEIPKSTRETVNRPGGLDETKLLDLILNPQDYGVSSPAQPHPYRVEVDYDIERCSEVGRTAIEAGHVAYCIMAGGAGTRIGEPKALLRLPNIDISLLTIKLFQAIGTGPIWIIVSPSLRQQIENHVRVQVGLDQERIKFVEQYESYRLTPDNQISFVDGKPELYPCGHGDLFPALTESQLLKEFVKVGGKYVSIVNVDNVMGALDPIIIGRHILAGGLVSCEVVERTENDAGGVICEVNGNAQVVESFRIHGADPKSFRWLNTNSFTMNADVDIQKLGGSWNRVQKNVNGRLVIQHERLLQEITAAYETKYLVVERSERFMPIKGVEDLKTTAEKLDFRRKLF